MSKVVRVHEHGGPDVLRIEELEVGRPGPGEVRLRIEAIGLNRSEAAFRAGLYPVKPKLPTLIGYEAAGIIEALGEGVQDFAVGDRVCVLPTFRLGEYGVYAERCHRAGAQHSCGAARPQPDPGRIDLDAISHRARDHRGCTRNRRRSRHHPRGIEQRRTCRDTTRELGGRGADCGDPSRREGAGLARAGREACDRN